MGFSLNRTVFEREVGEDGEDGENVAGEDSDDLLGEKHVIIFSILKLMECIYEREERGTCGGKGDETRQGVSFQG